MLKRSLKAILTSVFVLSMLSSAMVCSADETTAVTTAVSKYVSETVTTTPVELTKTNVTTSLETTETALETTAPIETTMEETVEETVMPETTTILTTITSEPITIIINDGVLMKLSYKDRLIAIQDRVDDYLYNTSLTPDDAFNVAREYLKRTCMLTEVSTKDMLYLLKYANNIVDAQNNQIKLNQKFYTNLENILSSTNSKNYTSIETYCKHLIKSGFKNGHISAKEAITLMNSIHDKVMDSLSQWDLDLITYSNYQFLSNQSLVNKWNGSYPDMKGWIYIADNPIDYPLMQYPFDNNYYLEHSWNGAESSRGTIELDYRCSLVDPIDTSKVTNNVLIYGHNLSDNTMFSSLMNYKSKSYWQDHQLIEINTDKDQRLYQIYATCSILGLADGTKFNYWNEKYISMDEDLFNEHIKLTEETMLYDTNILPEFGQDILTLQTCDGNDGWRIVIFAKRVK